jgi:hypothetical protein
VVRNDGGVRNETHSFAFGETCHSDPDLKTWFIVRQIVGEHVLVRVSRPRVYWFLYPPAGGYTASMLVSGEVDLAVQQIPELIFVSGVELVGPLPSDLQAITVYVAGIPASAKEPNVARALITFLRSPEAVTIIKAKGLDPG